MDEANRLVIQHLDTLRVPVHIICQVREELVHRTGDRATGAKPGYAALQESPRESFLMRLVPGNSRNSRALPVYESIVPKIDTSVISAISGGIAGGVQFTPSSNSTGDSSRYNPDSGRISTVGDLVWHKIVRRARKYCGSPEKELPDLMESAPKFPGTRPYGVDPDNNADDGDDTSDLAPDAQDDENYVSFPASTPRRQVAETWTSTKAKTKYKSISPHDPFSRRGQRNKGYVSLADASPMHWRWSPLQHLQNLSPHGTPRGATVRRTRQCWRALQQVFYGVFRCVLEPLALESARGRRTGFRARKLSKESIDEWSEPTKVVKYEDLGSIRKSLSLSTVPHLSIDTVSKPSVQHFNMDVGSNSSAFESDNEDGLASEAGSNRFEPLYPASEAWATPRVPRVQLATPRDPHEAARQERARRSLLHAQISREVMPAPAGVSSFTSCSSQAHSESQATNTSSQQSSEGGQTLKPSSLEAGLSAMGGAWPPQSSSSALPAQQSAVPTPLALQTLQQDQHTFSTKIRAPLAYSASRTQQVESADAGAGAPSNEVPKLFASEMEVRVAAPSMSPRDGDLSKLTPRHGEFSMADDDEKDVDLDSIDVDPWGSSEDLGHVQTRIRGWEQGKPVITEKSLNF